MGEKEEVGGGGKEEAGGTAEALHRFTSISVTPRPHLSNLQDRNLTDPTRERVLREHRVGAGKGSGRAKGPVTSLTSSSAIRFEAAVKITDSRLSDLVSRDYASAAIDDFRK